MERTVICPGSFDPVTLGHVDIITRAASMFDKVIVAVLVNSSKQPSFTIEERTALLEKALSGYDNIEIRSFDGLLADYARQTGATAVVKGLRAMSDFEYEFQMALTNRRLAPEIETLFMMPSESLAYVTASTVREVASYGGDTSTFVTEAVQKRLTAYAARLQRERTT